MPALRPRPAATGVRPRRLAALLTHPVQYVKPVLAALAEEPDLELLVIFGCDHGVRSSHDPDFGVSFAWDSSPAEGFPHRFASRSPLADLSNWRTALPIAAAAARRIRAFEPDAVLVFAYTPAFISLATLLLRATGSRLLLRAEATDRALPRSPARGRAKDLVLRLWYRMFHHVFPIGSDSEDHFRRLGVPPGRRTTVPYAVDVDYFGEQVARWLPLRAALRRDEAIPAEATVLLWSGKITDVKNPLLLLEALARLSQPQRDRLWLLVVGDGGLRPQFEAGAEGLLPGRCRFAGFRNQSELGRFYALADALVFPSCRGETWGLVVNEALQFGLKVVVSDQVGSARDLVAPVGAAPAGSAVFASGDAGSLAAALAGLLALPPSEQPVPAAQLPHPRDLAAAVATVVAAVVRRLPRP